MRPDLALVVEADPDERRPRQRDHGDRERYGEKRPAPVSDPEAVIMIPSVVSAAVHHGKNPEITTSPELMSASHEVAVRLKCCVRVCQHAVPRSGRPLGKAVNIACGLHRCRRCCSDFKRTYQRHAYCPRAIGC